MLFDAHYPVFKSLGCEDNEMVLMVEDSMREVHGVLQY
jgi:hypothetical protein